MRIILILICSILLMLGLGYYSFSPKPYYSGPKSDHFDGERFFDPLSPEPRGLSDFLKWKLTSKKSVWPAWVDVRDQPLPAERVEGEIVVTWINHATVLVQMSGVNILTDPVFSERTSPVSWAGPARVHKPGVKLKDLPPIDIVLISHDHYDALDIVTLEQLWQRDKPKIFAGLGVDTIVGNETKVPIVVNTLDWWEEVVFSDDVIVVFSPVQHWSKRWLGDRNYSLWGGFIIQSSVGNVFFSGDSGYTSYFKQAAERYGPFKLALIPIGAYEPRWFMKSAHINPEEAVQAFKDLETEYALGIHWGTFQLTDESRLEPVEQLEKAKKSLDNSGKRFRVLDPGESWRLAQ